MVGRDFFGDSPKKPRVLCSTPTMSVCAHAAPRAIEGKTVAAPEEDINK
jgi:hypothetical protein